jgi:UrcA family protein
MKHAFSNWTAFGVAVISVLAMASPACGKTPQVVVTGNPDMVTRQITYADLNLALPSGERVLSRRVSYAISGLCQEVTGDPHPTMLAGSAVVSGCMNSGWSQARPQIARAIERARELAATGQSTVAAAALIISMTPSGD